MSPRDAMPDAVSTVASSVFSQPTVVIDTGTIRLMSGYVHDELYLDLWGTYSDADGYEVEAVSLTGDARRVCLNSLAGSNEQLRRMEDFLCRSHEHRMASRKGEARLEQHLASLA